MTNHRRPLLLCALALLLSDGVVVPRPVLGQAAGEVLRNESVLQMVVGKVPKNVITSKIMTTPNAFELTPQTLVALAQNKVPKDIIKAMITASMHANSPKPTITNEDVVFMVTGKLPKDVILLQMQASRPNFDTSTNALIALNQNKVPQDIQRAMMTPGTADAPAAKGKGKS